MTMPAIEARVSPAWPSQFADFMLLGFAFYLMHGGIQVYVTELSQTARGSALSLHSASFFTGQAVGPILYGFGFTHLGTGWTLTVAALAIAGVGIGSALALRRPKPAS